MYSLNTRGNGETACGASCTEDHPEPIKKIEFQVLDWRSAYPLLALKSGTLDRLWAVVTALSIGKVAGLPPPGHHVSPAADRAMMLFVP
jgi:hypothetical protein